MYKLKIFNLIPLARDSVFQKLHDAIIVTNSEFLILDANKTACTVFESTFDKLKNKNISNVSLNLYQKLNSLPDRSFFEFEWVDKDLSLENSYIISIQELFSKTNKFYMIVLKDITHSKLADERTSIIRKQKEELEELIADLKKTQSQLIQSEKMASLGHLISGIAHEINNPIAAINSRKEKNQLSTELKKPHIQNPDLKAEDFLNG